MGYDCRCKYQQNISKLKQLEQRFLKILFWFISSGFLLYPLGCIYFLILSQVLYCVYLYNLAQYTGIDTSSSLVQKLPLAKFPCPPLFVMQSSYIFSVHIHIISSGTVLTSVSTVKYNWEDAWEKVYLFMHNLPVVYFSCSWCSKIPSLVV